VSSAYLAPQPLSSRHHLDRFRNRHTELVDWLQERALANELSRASRTFVVSDEAQEVVGYYALAAGSLELASAPGAVRRNMPAPLPAIVLARLAVHADHEGRGIGTGLLRDAVLRSLVAAQEIGARVLLCHAIDDEARDFYLRRGFVASPAAAQVVMLDLGRARG
jgi:predicted N-acetyltransferase YhbS